MQVVSDAGRLTVLVLASTYPRWHGDPEPGFVHELVKRLAKDFRVIVLGPHASGASTHEVLDGVEVHRYRYAPQRLETLVNDGGIVTNLRLHRWKFMLVPGFVLAQAWWAWRLLRREGVDVIHAHWLLPQGLLAAMLQFFPRRRVPYVVTSHGADLYALRGRVMASLKRFVLGRASTATVVSRAMRQEVERLGVNVGRVEVLPMGVDLGSRFTPEETPRSQDEILFVGRLVEKKGLHVLLEAMPEVVKERPDTRLTIVGFGPEEARLREQAQCLGLGSVVRFVGAVSQDALPSFYRRAALFVAPFVQSADGDREGLGLVTIEAIACGCPVVVGDLPETRDIFGDLMSLETSVTPGDSSALAVAILGKLDSPEEASTEALRLRESLLGRFDWERIGERYADILRGATVREAQDRTITP